MEYNAVLMNPVLDMEDKMIFLQIVIIGLLILLLVRSINHDSRVDKLEMVVGKLVSRIKVDEVMNTASIDGIFSHDTIENTEEVDTDGRNERSENF